MRHDISGKVVLITGPARGIGEATARRLAARGARLALVGLEADRLESLARDLGDGHAWFECDVTDQPSLDHAVAATVDRLGGIDVVMANAGIASHGTVAVAPVEALVRVIEVNLVGVVRTVSATLSHVAARRGYYLLVSSAAAFAAAPGIATYAAAKAGVEQFGNSLRLELAHRGVDVGTLHPCWIDTDMVRDPRKDLASFDRMLARLPGPFGTVTPLAECVDAIEGAIERRERRVYVPGSLAPFAAMRHLLWSRLAQRAQRGTATLVAQMEEESRAVGRSFGEHSVEVAHDPRFRS